MNGEIDSVASSSSSSSITTIRRRLFLFLEAKEWKGRTYENFTVFLIILNVVCFALGTYNENPPHDLDCKVCLKSHGWKVFFDVVEIVTCVIFTAEYALRFYAVVEMRKKNSEDPLYVGMPGRMRWALTSPYSWIDLATIVPFYVDVLTPGDMASSQFLRIMRLFRMFKLQSRYLQTFQVFDTIFVANAQLWQTAGFVGIVTWVLCSALYYWADKDTVDGDTGQKCWENIPEASYFTLLNLFGEYPLIDTVSSRNFIFKRKICVRVVRIFLSL